MRRWSLNQRPASNLLKPLYFCYIFILYLRLMENQWQKAFTNNNSLLIEEFKLEHRVVKEKGLQANDDSKPVQNQDSSNQIDHTWTHVLMDFRYCPTAKPKCSSRDKTFSKNQEAILCKGCKVRRATKGRHEKKLHNFQAVWTSLTCSLPQFSDSFFDSFNSFERSAHRHLNDEDIDNFFDTLDGYVNKNFIIGSMNLNALAGKSCELQNWIGAFYILWLQEMTIDASFPDSQFMDMNVIVRIVCSQIHSI